MIVRRIMTRFRMVGLSYPEGGRRGEVDEGGRGGIVRVRFRMRVQSRIVLGEDGGVRVVRSEKRIEEGKSEDGGRKIVDMTEIVVRTGAGDDLSLLPPPHLHHQYRHPHRLQCSKTRRKHDAILSAIRSFRVTEV